MTPSDFINTESLTLDEGRIYVVSGKDTDEVMALLDAAKTVIEGAGRDVLTYDSRFARSYFVDNLLPTRYGTIQRYARAYNAFAYDSIAPVALLTARGPDAEAPVINSISPNFGPNAGGTTVTISGENMQDVMLVTFDGALATIVSTSSTSVVVQSPSKSADGCVDVEVIAGERQAILYEHSSLTLGDFVILVGNKFDPADARTNFLNAGIVVDTMLDLFEAISVLSVKSSYSNRYGITRELWPFISRVYFYDVDEPEVIVIKPEQTPERPPFPLFPFITVSQPETSTSLAVGDVFDIKWNSFEIPPGIDVKIELYKGGVLQTSLTPSGTGLGYNTHNSGTFKWQVNDTIAGSDYQVRVSTVAAPLVSSLSDFFSIS